jgi:ribosomal protein S18 acetylase RimI-like enzyme
MIRIRDAVPADAAAVARMANGLAEITGVKGVGMTAETVRSDLIGGAGLTLLVGEVDGAVAGYVLYSVAYETGHAARGLYLSDIFVDETARRAGLGRAFLRELARRAREDGGRFLWWIVNPANAAAIAFYTGLGAHSEPLAAMALHGTPFEVLLDDGGKPSG